MTLSEMRTRVRYLLGEPSTTVNPFWTNTEIDAWINEGYWDFCEKTGVLQESYDQGFIVNQQEDVFPSHFISIQSMEWINSDDEITVLEPDYMYDLDRNDDNTGTPSKYYLRSNNIYGLNPIPDEAGTVRIYMSVVPTTVLSDDNDVPSIDSRYHHALIYYAVHLAKLKKKSDDAIFYKNRYEEYVLKAIINASNRVDGQPMRIIPRMDYYDEYLRNI